MSSWTDIISSIAPTIATALGGPLAGTAVSLIAHVITGDKNATQDQIEQAVTAGLSPEAIVALKKVENDFALQMKNADIDLEKLKSTERLAYVADTQAARQSNAKNEEVFILGSLILSAFAFVLAAVLVGCYELLTGGLQIKDPGTCAAISGLVGTIVGYFAANAQQVVGFYFGSSQGSAAKTDQLSTALGQAIGIKK